MAAPEQVEALYEAVPQPWAIMVLFPAWCQLRRGECLGLQRRDIEWHPDGTATLHVRRQLSANSGDYTGKLKSDAGKRSLSIPAIMHKRLDEHLRENGAPEAKARWFLLMREAACRCRPPAVDTCGWTPAIPSPDWRRGSVSTI